MKPTKFRGKRINNSKWVYGYYVQRLWDGVPSTSYIILKKCAVSNWQEILVPVIPETVGQFTGLLDKSGKEIYEGDRTNYGAVQWLETRLMWVVKMDNDCFISLVHFNDIEIIGNIHDNPKLEKEANNE